jgi:hypothetical protein
MVSKEVQDTVTSSVFCEGGWVSVEWEDLPYGLQGMYLYNESDWPDWMEDYAWDQAEAYSNGFAPWCEIAGCWIEGEGEFDSIKDHGRRVLVLAQIDETTAVLHPWQWSSAAAAWELDDEVMTWITL